MIRRLRTQQIIIDLPTPDSEAWIHLEIQQVDTDPETGETVNLVDRWGRISKKISDVALEVIHYDDQVLQHEDYMSTLGLSNAITVMAIKWIVEKYGGEVDEHGYIIV